MPAPSSVNGTWWGSIALVPKSLRLPISSARTTAVTAALMWTTVPPAKSMALLPSRFSKKPPPHTHLAMGA